MRAKNYMRDIPEDSSGEESGEERSIRDLRPSAARQRLQVTRTHEVHKERPRRRSRGGVWVAAVFAFLVLAGAAALIFFSSTSVTIMPRTHMVTFDASNPLTAYPAASAATGTIPYTVSTQVFEESAAVQATGTENVEEKASGNVTVYNETDRAMRLIKNTRFQTADGLIFRIPASVDIPAQKDGKPGSVEITVFADETGLKFNVPPGQFTLPGLKSSPDYSKIYAKSSTAFSGGFSGERPAVSPTVLESARADIRSRLEEKARALWQTATEGTVAFPGLVAISYESLPPTNDSGSGVKITERARVTMPEFPEAAFAAALGQAVSADAENANIRIRFSDGAAAQPVGAFDAADIGRTSITFALNGRGQLVWQVDAKLLQESLAGREEAAFQPIATGFVAIDTATARIAPFWKHSFPQDASSIKVQISDPPQF